MLQKSFLTYYSRHEHPVLPANETFTRKLILDFKAGVDYATHTYHAISMAQPGDYNISYEYDAR